MSRPLALVVCGPSGVGKGTLVGHIMKQFPEKFGFSVSHTTRSPRPGEQDGVHYNFTTKEAMLKEVAEGKFVEHAEVHDNLYGTSHAAVQTVLSRGQCCILDIDVQGARSVRKSGLPAVFVFVAPPSFEVLEQRLRGRGTETEDKVLKRLANARGEMEAMKEGGLFDFVVTNSDLDRATTSLAALAFRALHGCAPEKQGAALAFEFPAVAGAIPQGMDRLRDSTALVTGASAGIGRAIAGALGAAGLRVVAVARRGQRLQELRADLEAVGCGEGRYLAVEADVTDEAAVESIPARIREAFGEGSGVDVCVNNAGIGAQGTNLMGGNTADWRHVLDVNVVALCVVTRMAVQDMERRGRWGHVTHVSSMSGHRVASGSSAFYAGTKHMVRALADGLRMEARARGVPLRVGSLSPGFVDTEFFAVWSGDENAAPPLERPLQARDVAAALLFQLGAPEHVDVNDVLMRPLDQKS